MGEHSLQLESLIHGTRVFIDLINLNLPEKEFLIVPVKSVMSNRKPVTLTLKKHYIRVLHGQ